MMEFRLRSKIATEELEEKKGKILTHDDFSIQLTRDCRVLKPDGKVLAVYRRHAIPWELLDRSYATLHELKKHGTHNRGGASGMRRTKPATGRKWDETPYVASSVVGAVPPYGARQYCRLTAWTGRETERFRELFPLFQAIGHEFEASVPDRYRVQMDFVDGCDPYWVIEGTPFTTITVNNSYPTGVHTDKGDLESGFSNLTVLRRGSYQGGVFVFPEYRVGVDMQHGDCLLMDAHEWHGNTYLDLGEDGERISIVAYARTHIAECGSGDEEQRRALAAEERYAALVGE